MSGWIDNPLYLDAPASSAAGSWWLECRTQAEFYARARAEMARLVTSDFGQRQRLTLGPNLPSALETIQRQQARQRTVALWEDA